jgi:hypothetical protein
MIVVAVVVLAIPLVLMFTLSRGRLADSRGRKRSTRWSSRLE